MRFRAIGVEAFRGRGFNVLFQDGRSLNLPESHGGSAARVPRLPLDGQLEICLDLNATSEVENEKLL